MDYYDENGKRAPKKAAPDRWPILLLPLLLVLTLASCDLVLSTTDVPEDSAPGAGTRNPPPETTVTTRPAVVTARPPAVPPITPLPPYSYTEVVESGPLVLDPILASDAASETVIRNVMETLVYPHPHEADSYIPLLATGWRTTNESRTYTFSIRRGVRFSNGDALTASDVAYSLQRLLLASPPDGPQGLLLEPLLGLDATPVMTDVAGIITGTEAIEDVETGANLPAADIVARLDDGRYVGDRAALAANVPAGVLQELCQEIQSAIVANDGEGTLTIELAQPWSPFLSIVSQTWTSVIDRQWAIERGAWDGRCDTWQQWYALESQESALANTILGTGPYILDYWAPNAEHVLLANENYWRGENPLWDGGPFGVPALRSVRVQYAADADSRWELLESGVAQTAAFSGASALAAQQQVGLVCDWQSQACQPTEEGSAPLRQIENIPLWRQQALFFNFEIAANENVFLGSGQFDGDGIPSDFFHDEHVRKAFAYCLNDLTFIDAGMDDAGILAQSLVPSFIHELSLEYDGFPFGLQRCSDELALAWDGRLPNTGFRLQLPYVSDDAAQEAAVTILHNSLRAVNPAYRIEGISLPASLLEQAVQERRAPLVLLQWTPEMPDAYYWLAPAFSGEIVAFQRLPAELNAQEQDLLASMRVAGDRSALDRAYDDLNRFHAQHVPFVLLSRPSTTVYQQRTLETWLYNPADPLPYYYAFALR